MPPCQWILEQPGRCFAACAGQQESRTGSMPIQIEHQPFRYVSLVFFGAQQFRGAWAMLPGRSPSKPRALSAFLLMRNKR